MEREGTDDRRGWLREQVEGSWPGNHKEVKGIMSGEQLSKKKGETGGRGRTELVQNLWDFPSIVIFRICLTL